MRYTPAFWAAFWAGLAAPVALHAPPAPYAAYSSAYSVGCTFGLVGMSLTRMLGARTDDGRAETRPTGTDRRDSVT
jgi:hypothetical protein